GTDVLAYHIATNRYEVPVVPEFPLGRDGANESAAGWTMSKRPWLGGHTWNGIEYHPVLKRMVLLAREEGTPDNCIYYYDPIRAEWTKETITPGMSNSKYSSHACYTSLGMLSWFGNQIWKLDDATLQWQKLNITGTMPGTVVDNCGLVYDSKRNCIYFFTKGYAQPYSGVVHKLDLATLTVTALTPANAAFVSKADPLREVVYLPNQDLVVFAGTNGYHKNLLVYDPTSNLWRSAKVTTPSSVHAFDVSASIIYDTKRDLIWYLYNNYNSSYIVGDVHVLKIDKNTLTLDTIKADVPAYMTLSPDSSIIAPSGSIKLSTSLWCADSTPYTGTTLWSVENGGTIDANGLFTSNGTIGRFSVRAKAAADTMVSVNGTVYVLDMAMRFKFNDGTGTVATDSVATGMAGTFDGSLISWCSGKNDSAICFNGTGHATNRILFKNSRIRFQNNFTMSFWAKPTGATPYINNYSNYERLLIPASGGIQTWGETSAGIGIILGNNSITLYESPSIHSASTTQFKFDTTFTDWTHITIAYTNRVPKLYINGILVKTGTTSVNTIVRPSINLGGDYRSWYIGSIDELTLFTRSLSDAEISKLAGGVFTGEEKHIVVNNDRLSLRIAPNPCNPSTLLRVSLPGSASDAKLSIMNASGQVVAHWDLTGRTGTQQLVWKGIDVKGSPVATGVYLVSLQAGKNSLKQRLMLIR
ncbi:MAG: T9SS type A sorting domain-containing protein, partial [Fibrobacteres bacterium]|nr:T9SS type A sorting domain-containing protein [Fibrobacterota bacterium]